MSSEAITQNDLREILSRTVGSVPSEYKKLLWANPNPSVAFGAQTVVSGIDVSAYDDIEVIIKANINVGIGKSNIFKYASAGTWAVSGPPTVNDTWVGVRRVTINATSISFGNGGYAYWSSTSANYAHNDYAIPLAVYGIKYERVALPQLGVVPLQVATFQKNTSFVAGAGSLVFDTPLPEGAIIKSRCISRNPNAQWLYCGIHTVSATSTTVAYRNNFSSAFSGTMELSVFYEIAN